MREWWCLFSLSPDVFVASVETDYRSAVFKQHSHERDCGELPLLLQLLWIALLLYFFLPPLKAFAQNNPRRRLCLASLGPDGPFSESDKFVVGSFCFMKHNNGFSVHKLALLHIHKISLFMTVQGKSFFLVSDCKISAVWACAFSVKRCYAYNNGLIKFRNLQLSYLSEKCLPGYEFKVHVPSV